MKEPATEFGASGVTRERCDNLTCGKIILFTWKGRDGVYCTNACLKRAERTNEMTDATATIESPISGGTPAATKKAPAKKAAKKVAPASKKTAAKKAPAAKTAAAKKTVPAAKKAKNTASPKTPAAKGDPFNAFRAGTAKAAVATVLGDGKYHAFSELVSACEKAGTGAGQARFALAQLAEKGHSVEWKNGGKEEVRVTKAKQ